MVHVVRRRLLDSRRIPRVLDGHGRRRSRCRNRHRRRVDRRCRRRRRGRRLLRRLAHRGRSLRRRGVRFRLGRRSGIDARRRLLGDGRVRRRRGRNRHRRSVDGRCRLRGRGGRSLRRRGRRLLRRLAHRGRSLRRRGVRFRLGRRSGIDARRRLLGDGRVRRRRGHRLRRRRHGIGRRRSGRNRSLRSSRRGHSGLGRGRGIRCRRGDNRCAVRHEGRRGHDEPRRQERERVDVPVRIGRDTHAEMHVALAADEADDIAFPDGAAARDGRRTQVDERDRVAVRRPNRDDSAAPWDGAGEGHRPARRGEHGRAGSRADRNPAVLPTRVRMRRVEGEVAQHRTVRRPRPGARAGDHDEQRESEHERDATHRGSPPCCQNGEQRKRPP